MLKFILILLGLILLSLFLHSSICLAVDCNHTDTSFNCVTYVDNYDGDTITVDIPNVHPFFGHNAHVRVYGVDTPEMTSTERCGKTAALKARNRVRELLTKAKRIDLTKLATEKYGRILAVVTADGVDIGSLLLSEKLAYEYHGDTKKKIDWCKFQK